MESVPGRTKWRKKLRFELKILPVVSEQWCQNVLHTILNSNNLVIFSSKKNPLKLNRERVLNGGTRAWNF